MAPAPKKTFAKPGVTRAPSNASGVGRLPSNASNTSGAKKNAQLKNWANQQLESMQDVEVAKEEERLRLLALGPQETVERTDHLTALRVVGLPATATQRELHVLFCNCPGFLWARARPLAKSGKTPQVNAIVNFKTHEDALAAAASRSGTTWEVGSFPVGFIPVDPSARAVATNDAGGRSGPPTGGYAAGEGSPRSAKMTAMRAVLEEDGFDEDDPVFREEEPSVLAARRRLLMQVFDRTDVDKTGVVPKHVFIKALRTDSRFDESLRCELEAVLWPLEDEVVSKDILHDFLIDTAESLKSQSGSPVPRKAGYGITDLSATMPNIAPRLTRETVLLMIDAALERRTEYELQKAVAAARATGLEEELYRDAEELLAAMEWRVTIRRNEHRHERRLVAHTKVLEAIERASGPAPLRQKVAFLQDAVRSAEQAHLAPADYAEAQKMLTQLTSRHHDVEQLEP